VQEASEAALYLLDQNVTVFIRRLLVTMNVQVLSGYAVARDFSCDCVWHIVAWSTISRDSVVKIHVIRLWMVSCKLLQIRHCIAYAVFSWIHVESNRIRGLLGQRWVWNIVSDLDLGNDSPYVLHQ